MHDAIQKSVGPGGRAVGRDSRRRTELGNLSPAIVVVLHFSSAQCVALVQNIIPALADDE